MTAKPNCDDLTTSSGTPPSSRQACHFVRTLEARPALVWLAWTDVAMAQRWLAPRHFKIIRFELDPVPDSVIKMRMTQDGTQYAASGLVLSATEPSHLVFELAPDDEDGEPLFRATYALSLEASSAGTQLDLHIEVCVDSPAAAAAISGMEAGWGDLLDQLQALFAGSTQRAD